MAAKCVGMRYTWVDKLLSIHIYKKGTCMYTYMYIYIYIYKYIDISYMYTWRQDMFVLMVKLYDVQIDTRT